MQKLLFILLLFVSACVATKSIAPSSEALPAMQERVPGITLERADKGFVLYKNKCAACHRLHSPSEFTISGWEKSLVEMYPKAKVNDVEKKLIRDYLFSLSK